MEETKEASGIANYKSGETEEFKKKIALLHLSHDLSQFNDFRPENCTVRSFNE
jgi:CRISPR/Cas system CMR-associated protein Cmr5 small subunit